MSRHRRTSIQAGLAATAAASLVTATAAYAATPGSAGIGDPYYPTYGNGGYTVSHYDVDVTYLPSTTTVRGVTTITAVATQDLSRFNLDLLLTASKVTINGQAARFAKPLDRHELVITPARAIAKGTKMVITVTYAGQPKSISYGGVASPWIGGGTETVALGEPEIAAWWFPSNDHPRDKATFNLTFRVPKGLEAVGPGTLTSKTTVGTTDVWKWSMPKPMATYLAFMAIGQYTLYRGATAGRPYVVAIANQLPSTTKAAAKRDLLRTPEVINWEASQFGPYAFNTVGGVVPSPDFGYALETQTRPVYTSSFWKKSNIGVVVHENAHQWFGDSVSVHNWKDVWLNEGFATYAEFLWDSQQGGPTPPATLADYYRQFGADDYIWDLRISDPGAHNEFDWAVYVRGGMTLAALRNRIGAAKLTTILKQWTASHRYGNGTIADFTALAKRVSGQNLDGFFQHWLVDRRKPAQTAENGLNNLPAATPEARATADRILANAKMLSSKGHTRR